MVMVGSQTLVVRLLGTAGDTAQEAVDSAQSLWENFAEAAPRYGVGLAVIVVGWLVARGVRWVVHRALKPRETPSFSQVMSKIASWFVFAVFVLAGMVVAFPSVQPVDMLAGLGFFSVAVGFAFQDIFENTLAGVLLLFRQPFQTGDQVEVQEQLGTVQAITIRETQIRTFDGELILIPNSDVYKSIVRVQTHFELHRKSFIVGIAYENDANAALAIIERVLSELDGVVADPAPQALVSQLNVSTVDIECRVWCQPVQSVGQKVLSDAMIAVMQALDEHGIEMPADIIALQATPSFKAALQDEAEVTPGGAVKK